MAGENFSLLDTRVGDRVLNADAIAAIMAADPTAGQLVTDQAQTFAGVKTLSSAPVMSGASIEAETIPASALENGAGVAALLGAGLGNSANFAKTASGAQTILAANGSGDGDRTVLITVVVTEVFADGDNAQTVFIIGQTGTTNKFMANTVLVDAADGAVFTFAGTLTEQAALLVTCTPAAGTGTGAISVTVLALPAAS